MSSKQKQCQLKRPFELPQQQEEEEDQLMKKQKLNENDQTEIDDKGKVCMICQDQQRNSAFQFENCGHMIACYKCAIDQIFCPDCEKITSGVKRKPAPIILKTE